ncbi:MAG: glycosyltransferase family 4 protein [Vicingaceae bacterium]
MKILQVHNYYQLRGGEATVVETEKKLLEENGHEVITYYRNNKEIAEYSLIKKVRLLKDTTWSDSSYNEVLNILKENKPDVCHVHNTLPIISPSVYAACKAQNVPIVQTLHNYRLICANGLFFRDGKVCEDCLGKSAYNAVAKKCYRNSTLQTYTVARMVEKNKTNNIWSDLVDAYLCFTDFAKNKFVEHGLPKDKIFIKPNFVDFNLNANHVKEDYLIYVGRLDENKGVRMFKKLSKSLKIPIKIVGEGDLKSELENLDNIELLGKQPYEKTINLIQKAKALILPSFCYEGMPMTILEAFASKTLVVASNLGAMQTMINHKQNGLLFKPKAVNELQNCIDLALENHAETMVKNAYLDYKNKYSKTANYNALMNIYTKITSK